MNNHSGRHYSPTTLTPDHGPPPRHVSVGVDRVRIVDAVRASQHRLPVDERLAEAVQEDPTPETTASHAEADQKRGIPILSPILRALGSQAVSDLVKRMPLVRNFHS